MRGNNHSVRTCIKVNFILFLQDMFVFGITAVKEVALAANTNVPVNRLKWTTDGKYHLL